SKTGSLGSVAYPYPVNVSLSHMPNALCFIDVAMYLSFDDRLKILLHLTTGSFYDYAKGQPAALFKQLLPVIGFDDNLVVLYIFHFPHSYPFKCSRLLTAELYKGIFLPYPLALECRPESNWNRRFLNGDLKSPYFNRLLDDPGMVKFLINMFICTYTCREDNRHIRVADSREAHIYRAGPGCPFDVIHRAEGYCKCKDPVLLV